MGIKIRNLEYVYMQGSPFEKKALSDINLDITDGEFVGLIGHTGSGKSTLIQHLNGLLVPQIGGIEVNGISTKEKGTKLKELRQEVGLVFQYPEHQLFEESVYKDVAFGPKNMGLSENEIHERVVEALSYVGLDDSYYEMSPFELSGGQRRRVAIAGVLALRPKTLILDEPAAGLDPAGREEILTQIRTLYLKSKMTVILVSHSMEDIARISNRIIVMNDSKIAMDGNVSEIFSRGDELKKMGLDVPQVSALATELINRGVKIDSDIYTIERAKTAIMHLAKEKRRMEE